jgi:hypothetical protein
MVERTQEWWLEKARAEGDSEVGAGAPPAPGKLDEEPPISYIERFVGDPDRLFEQLKAIEWERRDDAPRFEYYCNDYDEPYTYGRGRGERTYERQPMPEAALYIRVMLEAHADAIFEACFLNRYEDARDHLGWHADDSPEMDSERPIAIVSLGAEREIWFRRKGSNALPRKLLLQHGSLCLMAPRMQMFWEHRIPKASFQCGERISLTFRGYVKQGNRWERWVPLWDAINAYTRACGGDPSSKAINDARMDAVARIEEQLRKMGGPRG